MSDDFVTSIGTFTTDQDGVRVVKPNAFSDTSTELSGELIERARVAPQPENIAGFLDVLSKPGAILIAAPDVYERLTFEMLEKLDALCARRVNVHSDSILAPGTMFAVAPPPTTLPEEPRATDES